MPRNIHHIVNTTHQPNRSIIIELCTIASKINAVPPRPVSLFVTPLLSPNTSQHRWPRFVENEITTMSISYRNAVIINNFRTNARKRFHCRTRFSRSNSWQRRDHDCPCLRLPPCINNRTAISTNNMAIPDPCFRIDRFANRT